MNTPTQRVEEVLARLAAMLPKKVDAYGAAHELQPLLWEVLLRQYEDGASGPGGPQMYLLPRHVALDMPRLTRCLDRVCRIVSSPTSLDPMGENPWLDLAGDAIAGAATLLAREEADKRLVTGNLVAWGECDG